MSPRIRRVRIALASSAGVSAAEARPTAPADAPDDAVPGNRTRLEQVFALVISDARVVR